mgnify:CR=1 FL=1
MSPCVRACTRQQAPRLVRWQYSSVMAMPVRPQGQRLSLVPLANAAAAADVDDYSLLLLFMAVVVVLTELPVSIADNV